MTDEAFETLVTRLEEQARRRPAWYKARVLLLAMLGNAYLSLILLVLAALLVSLVVLVTVLKALAIKLIIVVGVFLWMLLKALWIKLSPPEGLELDPADAPELFAMIDKLHRRLGAPRLHHVLIDDTFNAGVAQVPRLGIFGWPRNYLIIGLPLMKALTKMQFQAVLAHEFGHLAGGHGLLSNWVYRQRLRWSRLIEALGEQNSRGSFLFHPFLRWYAPYFNAYSFPLARANEYEADAASARLTSPRAAAEALTGVNVVGSYLGERYWAQIHKQADELPQPAFMPYADMGVRVASDLGGEASQEWLRQAMERKTTVADTHPALSDRLSAIGETPRLASPAPGKAADRLLGPALEAVTTAFDRRWHDAIREAWEERHQEVQEGRRQLSELNQRFASGAELTLQEAYDRARLTETVGDDAAAALAQLRALHERAPQEAVVCYALGARLLVGNDETGIALLETAMAQDEDFIMRGCEALRDWHWSQGRQDMAHAWHRRLVERSEVEQASDKERNEVLLNDKFDRHELDCAALEALRASLRAVPGLHRAYLVKKRLQHFSERPCYVLGFSVTRFWQMLNQKRIEVARDKIRQDVSFPGETIIICIDGDNYRFGRKLRWSRKSRVV